MNQIVYMAEGAAILAVGFGLWIVVREAWRLGVELRSALSGIPKLVESNQRLTERLDELVRLLTAPLTPNFGVEEGAAPAPVRGQMPARPPVPYEMFRPDTYEAAPEETEVIDTTDQELVEAEEIESLKERGYDVEETNPPGVTASV